MVPAWPIVERTGGCRRAPDPHNRPVTMDFAPRTGKPFVGHASLMSSIFLWDQGVAVHLSIVRNGSGSRLITQSAARFS